MNNQQAVVDQIVQNLAFEVEAVPKDRTLRTTSISKSTPLNVKIRVRKKDDTQTLDVSSVIDEPTNGLQKVRLVSSHQSIMSFDVFVETEFEKKPLRRSRKYILDILKPGTCLGAMDDEVYPYMPSSSYSAKMTGTTVATRSDGVLKRNFILSKTSCEDYLVSNQSDRQKWLFGKCKPGGCLDPPFSEDKYSYKPSLRTRHDQIVSEPDVIKNEKLNEENVKNYVKTNGRHSSIFDGGIFKKKRKCSDKSTNTLDSKEKKTDSILSIYQPESTVNSLSTHSNSLITYPPKRSSENISDDKTLRGRGPSEDKSRKSFNDHSEPCFIPPKGINRLKEKYQLIQKDLSKHRSSDTSNTKTKPGEYFKLPVPLPIPIPIPIPVESDQHKPEDVTVNTDFMKTQVDDGNTSDTKIKKSSDDKINLKHIEIPERPSKTELAIGVMDYKLLETLKMPSPVTVTDDLFKQELPTLDEDAMKQGGDINDNISPNGTRILKKEIEQEPTNIPIPILAPLNVSKPERRLSITQFDDPNAENSDISMSKIGISEGIKDTPSEGFKRKKSSERESSLTALNTNLQYLESDSKEIKADPMNYLCTQSEPLNEGIDTKENENIITKEPMQGDMTREIKVVKITGELKQNSIEHKEDQEMGLIDTTTENDLEKTPNRNTIKKIKTSAESIDGKTIDDQSEKDLSDNTDLLKNMLRSGLEDEIDSVSISPINRDKESAAGSTKLQQEPKLNDVYSFSDGSRITNDGNFNFITAPVIINPSDQIPHSRQLKQVHSETNLVDKSEILGYVIEPTRNIFEIKLNSNLKTDDDDTLTHSSVSGKLIGTSVIYDIEDFLPLTSSVKPSENLGALDKRVVLGQDVDKGSTEINPKSPRIFDDTKDIKDELNKKLPIESTARNVSVLSPTNTLKSSLKKDKISVELAFQSYLNDKNERILRSFDAANKPTRLPNDSITVIKSQIRLSSNEIRIPVDSDHDISIQIKKSTTNQRVSLSESLGNTFEKDKIKQKAADQTSGGEIKSSGEKEYNKIIESENIMDSNVIDLYEQELVPLQLIIKNLKDEIDVLAAQQLVFRDKVFCPKKSKLPRLVHTNKKCVGCLRK